MMFSADSVYGVKDGEVSLRRGTIAPDADEVFVDFDDTNRPIMVDGVRADDFAIYATWVSLEEGASPGIPYFVTSVKRDSGIIVPVEKVERETRSYMTPELARKLQSVPDDELLLLGITGLVKSLDLRFPR